MQVNEGKTENTVIIFFILFFCTYWNILYLYRRDMSVNFDDPFLIVNGLPIMEETSKIKWELYC